MSNHLRPLCSGREGVKWSDHNFFFCFSYRATPAVERELEPAGTLAGEAAQGVLAAPVTAQRVVQPTLVHVLKAMFWCK